MKIENVTLFAEDQDVTGSAIPRLDDTRGDLIQLTKLDAWK